MDHDHSRPFTYSEETALAKELVERGDHKHALHHCIGALSMEPHRREWHTVLDELLAKPGIVGHLEGDTFFGAKAALAYHLRARGGFTDALDLIANVAAAMPNLGFHRWFARWLEEAVAARASIEARSLVRVMLIATTFGIGRIRMLPSERATAMELVPIARYAAESTADPMVLLLASSVLRRADLGKEAVAAGEKALPDGDPLRTATALGLAVRAVGDFDRAIEIFEGAYARSKDPIYLQEKLRVLADAGRWSDADALAKQIQKMKEPDGENRREYAFVAEAACAKAPPPSVPPLDNVRRRVLGHGTLLAMADATANAMLQMARDEGLRAKGPRGMGETLRESSVKIGVSGSEGPSARLCLALMFSGTCDPRRAEYQNDTPPRMLSDDVDQYTLWKREGGVDLQALPAPPDAVLDWVETLALFDGDTAPESVFAPQTDFLDLWEEAQTRPLPEATARDWVAATIHPRMPVFRVGMGPAWLYRWQTVALIGLARSIDRWAGSPGRDALLSLLRGVVDWPLAAAIRVATELALHDPDALEDVRRVLIELESNVADVPNGAIPWTLVISLEALPLVPDHICERLRAASAKAEGSADEGEAEDDQEDDEQEDEEQPEQPQEQAAPRKRPWWKLWGN